jgi:uncharacterized membrane protein YvbJ
LIMCPECKKEISDQAVVCPNCGYPISKQEIQKPNQILNKEKTIDTKKIATYSIVIASVLSLLAFLSNIITYPNEKEMFGSLLCGYPIAAIVCAIPIFIVF